VFNREKREAGGAALRAEVDRLAALAPPNLAGEVMSSVFGEGHPGADGSPLTVITAADEFISEESAWSDEDLTREQLVRIVGEGLQLLEHAFLIHQQVVLVDHEHWALGWSITRYGETALAQGTVAQALGTAN
jgi:hypothetical protein